MPSTYGWKLGHSVSVALSLGNWVRVLVTGPVPNCCALSSCPEPCVNDLTVLLRVK